MNFHTVVAFLFFLTIFSETQPEKDFIPIGFTLGDLTLGERVITFHRLLPFDHPETQGHQFPTATVFTKKEVEIFMHLGNQIGWNLYATLWRHPATPVDDWMYPDYPELPLAKIKELAIVKPKSPPPLKGLKAVCFLNNEPVIYIIDTRGITLAERGMQRATAGGIDMTRREFLDKLREAQKESSGSDGIIIYK